MRYRGLGTVVVAALAWISVVPPALAQTTCKITSPSSAEVNQSFTLCGPTGRAYTYEWYGPGLNYDNETRCVTARVATSGTYEYVLVIRQDNTEVDRCKKVINVGGSTGGARSCEITGPSSIQAGESARLCGPNDGLHTYSWTGPGNYTASGPCITVVEEGTYYLTSRNSLTGSSRQCTHRLTVVGQASTCDISGPSTIAEGTTVRLCAPTRGNTSYRWTGPRGFTASTRCITAEEPGQYSVALRDPSSGRTERCSQTLVLSGNGTGDDQDPDEVVWDNCPRDLQFWRRVFGNGGSVELSQADLRAIARFVDERSAYFNWRDDLQGMRQALSPGGSMTRRKQVVRQFAALLANVAAGELGLLAGGREQIGLDPNTRVNYTGATTLRELIALTDRTLNAQRGNYARLNSALTLINRGRGIGPVCE